MERSPQLISGRYRVDARLGEGAQAIVLRVHDVQTGVDRALKRLLPAYSEKRKLRARFEAEARALASLDHPNLVRVLDVATDGPLPYFVMELVEGGSLVRRLERDGALPPRLAVHVALQVCEGLAVAHRAGIVHRDVKPHNVLVGLDGTCKVTDFGIARMGEAGLRTRAGASLGTEGFMAPEQAADAASVDGRADVYGVGMTLFVLLTSEDPWMWVSGRGRKAVPEALLPLLDRATEDKADDRHPDIHALADDLRACLDALPPDPAGATLVTTSGPPDPVSHEPEAMTRISEPEDADPTEDAPSAPAPRRSVVEASIGGRPGELDARLVPPQPDEGRWLRVAGIVAALVAVAVASLALVVYGTG